MKNLKTESLENIIMIIDEEILEIKLLVNLKITLNLDYFSINFLKELISRKVIFHIHLTRTL